MNAYIFDVDGVILDQQTKEITEPEIIRFLHEIIKRGDVLTFNTGRAFAGVEEKILTPLLEMTEDKSLFKHVFVCCEMGNVLATYKNGAWDKKIMDDPFPTPLQNEIKKMVEDEFSESMFYNDTKETMVTVEMKDGFDLAVYSKRQEQIYEKLSELLLQDKYLPLGFKISKNMIAIDIQYEDSGKHLGAERIEDWLLEENLKPEKLYMIGDNHSDSEMAEELQDKYTVVFVFVNDKSKLTTDRLMCEVVYTAEKFTKGTLEFLKSQTA